MDERSDTRECKKAREWGQPARIERVRRNLTKWGKENFQRYTWRAEQDPWQALVAEVLLQRTNANQVEPVFRVLRERCPTAESLVSAGEDQVLDLVASLGLHKRVSLLRSLAAEIASRGGSIPETQEALDQLPAVGHYTASAWLSMHRGKRAVILDKNVARVLGRLTGCSYPSDLRRAHWVRELAERLTPRRMFRDYNYAIIDFAMRICTRRNPRHVECPLRGDCTYVRSVGASGVGKQAGEHDAIPPMSTKAVDE